MAVMLEFLGMTWMAILFLMSVALFAVDAVTGFGYFLTRFVPDLRGLALVAGVVLSVVALIQGCGAGGSELRCLPRGLPESSTAR